MPYLKLSIPKMSPERYQAIAERLTNEINVLFYNPKGRITKEQLRERTTIHFTPYKESELYIGAKAPSIRNVKDITIELSDWNMTVRKQKNVANKLTPVLADLFDISKKDYENINIRFHSYPPSDFAVGGKLLSDIVPFIGRIAKRLWG